MSSLGMREFSTTLKPFCAELLLQLSAWSLFAKNVYRCLIKNLYGYFLQVDAVTFALENLSLLRRFSK